MVYIFLKNYNFYLEIDKFLFGIEIIFEFFYRWYDNMKFFGKMVMKNYFLNNFKLIKLFNLYNGIIWDITKGLPK